MTVAVVGLGLIGGSFVKALALAQHTVYVSNRTRTTAQKAVDEGYAQGILTDDFSIADVILIALPPACVVEWIDAHQVHFKQGATVVDATGVKGTICTALEKYASQDRWFFVGGHPMAGREVSGWENASAKLFKGASMILTPFPSCGRTVLDALEKLFRSIGFSRIVLTTPQHHDEMIALTSQLAHVVSSAYMQEPLAREHIGYSAGSFHDMTRVAHLDPEIWTELFSANRPALLQVLSSFIDRLTAFRTHLEASDASAIKAFLARGRSAYDSVNRRT